MIMKNICPKTDLRVESTYLAKRSHDEGVLVLNFNFSAMKGGPAREEKLKFLIRGGLF